MAKATTKASRNYNSKMYERMEITVKLGQKDVIREFAESKGLSMNAYIKSLIYADMGITEPSMDEVRELPVNKYTSVKIPKYAEPANKYWVDMVGNIYCQYAADPINMWYAVVGDKAVHTVKAPDGYWVNSKGKPI